MASLLSQEEGQKIVSTNTTSHDDANNVYETDQSLHMYLGLHYPESGGNEGIDPILNHVNAPNHALRFPQRVAALLVDLLRKQEQQQKQTQSTSTTGNTQTNATSISKVNTRRRIKKALDIGCAVGGSSFELAKTFDHVDAFDYSTKFIDVAKKMQQQGSKNNKNNNKIRFKIPIEAELFEEVEARHDDGVDETILSKVNFFVGDACNLKDMQAEGKIDNVSSYDGIIMSNLLCRLSDPMACLTSINGIVKKNGGIVVIVTPYSWLEEFTSRGKWLGGYYNVENADEESSSSSSPSTTENNEKPLPTKNKVYSKDVLTQVMEGNGFVKIHEEKMPLIIREHQRKYQYIISEATGWLLV